MSSFVGSIMDVSTETGCHPIRGLKDAQLLSLLKMNAQDEQQWREIHAKAITVSFCKAQKISVIIN